MRRKITDKLQRGDDVRATRAQNFDLRVPRARNCFFARVTRLINCEKHLFHLQSITDFLL